MKTSEHLTAVFIAEIDERARALGRELLALERQPQGSERVGLIDALFRTAHSLKGAAGAMGVEPIELVCHRLEDIFSAARESRLDLEPDLFRLFFTCVDAIQEAGQILRRGEDISSSALAILFAPLDEVIDRAALAEPVLIPAAPPRETKRATIAPSHDEPIVRIAAQKLDALAARSGELLLLSRRADARLEELSSLRASLRRCQAEWRAIERQLPLTARGGSGGDASGPHIQTTRDVRTQRTPAVTAGHAQSLRRLLTECDQIASALVEDRRALEEATGPLDAEVRRARMLPFASACDELERLVRDLSTAEGKQVELSVSGGELELDRSVIQRLRHPLIHLVRNAVDHGIEDVIARRALGKPAMGHITVRAMLLGTRVEVSVADDGPGLDLAAIRERGRELQLADAEGHELIARIFLPGFSTHQQVTQVSGRGIGLDAVKTAAEAMRGSVDVSHEPNRGTRFVLSLPLTLSTVRTLMLGAGGEIFAIDAANIVKLLVAAPDRFASAEGRTVLLGEAEPVPVIALANLLGMGDGHVRDARSSLRVALLQAGHRRLGVVVDEFLDEQEVVVRSLGPRLDGLMHISGGTVLSTGKVALILNVPELVRSALSADGMPLPRGGPPAVQPAAKKRVLLVDDSLTTRTLERSILEIAGYDVTAAADGDEAWRLLLEGDVDIVVTDVDMPRMDGFALTAAIRGSARFSRLPVVLVTARESAQDKTRGMQVGADIYLVKSAFDQDSLLDALARLL